MSRETDSEAAVAGHAIRLGMTPQAKRRALTRGLIRGLPPRTKPPLSEKASAQRSVLELGFNSQRREEVNSQ
jgi:hypothetical protein